MSLPILNELQEDLKRLTIAGSDLSIGDISLKKKIPVLMKMGEKAPVFNRLAHLTETLVSGKEPTSEHLLELSTLLTSVMYTMGKTGREGEWEKGADMGEYPTELSYSTIKPIIEALTTKGSGRMEIIEQAYQSGKIVDLRLVYPLITALDDSYPEIADFVAEKIFPMYGSELLPVLQASFSMKGKKGDGRKLKVMAQMLGEEGLPFYYDCIENGSPQVQIAGLEILSDYEVAEDMLISYTKAKKSDVRLVVYKALTKRESETAVNCLIHALEGKDRDLIIEAAVAHSTDTLKEAILGFAKGVLGEYLESKKQDKSDLLGSLIHCFWHSKSKKVASFLRELIDNSVVQPSIARQAIMVLNEMEPETTDYIESIFQLPGRSSLVDISFLISIQIRSKEEVYDLYANYVKKTRKDPVAKEILEVMDRVIFFRADLREYDDKYYRYQYHYYSDDFYENPRIKELEWDERWIELMIELDEEKLVYRLAHKINNKKHLEYLLKKLKENPYFSSNRGMGVMTSLIQTGYEDVFPVLVDTLKKTDVNMNSVKFHTSSIVNNLGLFLHIPKKYVDDLQKIAEHEISHEKLKERLQEIVFDLKNREGK
jgi:hypothetical protein